MNRSIFSSRRLAAAALGLAALGAATASQARTDVHLSIGVPVAPAPVVVAPQPVYVPPQPVYVPQQPVYVQPRPVYVQPQPVYVQPQPVYGYGYGRGWGDERWGHRGWHHRHGWGDADRDGVPNRFDRFPGNPGRH